MKVYSVYIKKIGIAMFVGIIVLTFGCNRENAKIVSASTEKTSTSTLVNDGKTSNVSTTIPNFSDFLAGKIYQGTAAEAQNQQVYYWPMTSANEEIKRVLNQQPDYAGEYLVFSLDCGIDNCTMTYIANKRTGQIITAFRSASIFDDNGREIDREGEEVLDYQLDSKLIITRNNLENDKPMKNFYIMENGTLKKIYTTPAD